MFPNKHDIYMHDTPQRELFDQTRRDVQPRLHARAEPGTLAELLLAEDKGWPAEHVRGLLAQGGYNNEVQLAKEIPGARDLLHDGGRRGRAGELATATSTATTAACRLRSAASRCRARSPRQQRRRPARDARRPRQQKPQDFFSGLFGN